MGKELSLEEKVKRSKLVIREFPKVDLQRMCRRDREKLVGIVCDDIYGVPLPEVPYKQLVTISYSVYNSAQKYYLMDKKEITIREELKELENSNSDYERERLIERLGIKLEENIGSEVAIKYRNLVEKFYPFEEKNKDPPF